MNNIAKNIIKSGLALCSKYGVTSSYRRKSMGACIFMYHGFSEGVEKGLENHSRLHLDIKGFRDSAKMFAKHYNVISLQELADLMDSGKQVPDNTVVLTFDDGYASNYHLAFPVLKEFGLHATVFTSTAFVEKEMYQWPDRIEYAIDRTRRDTLSLDFKCLPMTVDLSSIAKRKQALVMLDSVLKTIPQDEHLDSIAHIEERAGVALADEKNPAAIYQALSWEQVRELEASDHVSIGAHTHTHPILGRCSEELARKDMEQCIGLLRRKVGIENPTFAYPNGQAGDYNESTKKMLQDLGVSVAVTTVMEFNDSNSDIMTLYRMGTPQNGYEADTICSGFVPRIKKQFSSLLNLSFKSNSQIHANY